MLEAVGGVLENKLEPKLFLFASLDRRSFSAGRRFSRLFFNAAKISTTWALRRGAGGTALISWPSTFFSIIASARSRITKWARSGARIGRITTACASAAIQHEGDADEHLDRIKAELRNGTYVAPQRVWLFGALADS